MAILLRRLPSWLVLATAAVALQAVSLLVAPATRYEIRLLGPCASEQGSACLLATFQPTHPYLWLGVGLYLVGATAMGFAIEVHRRTHRRLR